MKITRIEALDYVGLSGTLPIVDGVTTLTGANAAGKTMVTNIVPGILFNEVTLRKGETIGFGWDTDTGNGSMLVSKQGQKTLWRGTFDGKSKEHNTIKAANGWLREYFPVSDSVFPTANYLAAFRSGTMLGGKPAERKALLSDIVGLRVFDDLRAGINKLAQQANVTLALRNRIEEDLRQLSDMGVASRPVINLSGVANGVAEHRSYLRSEAMRLADALEDRPYGNIPTPQLREVLKIAPERNKAWDAWDECQKLNVYDIKRPSEADYKTACALRDILESNRKNVELLTGSVAYIFGHAREQKKLLSLSAEIDNISEQLAHLDGHDGDRCPTCNSKINTKLLRKTLTRTYKKLLADRKEQQTRVEIAKASDTIRDISRTYGADLKEIRVMLAFDHNDIIESYDTSEEIKARFGGELPVKPTKPRIDIGEVTNELRLRKRGYGMLDDGERKYAKLAAKYKGATGVLSAVTDIVEEQAETIANQRRLAKLRSDLAALPNSEDAELLFELLKALENRNARDRYLELVAEHLISTLNDLAPAFFSYKMEFAWTNGKLIANRKGAATDTVLLSGREGRTFMLLNAVAIQCCLPPAKRLRTLFLDEIEAGSDPSNRALLAELIPPLTDHYDNIVVVTPLAKSEFYVEGPRYRVTNDKRIVREE